MTARDYADDRSLIFYCLRGSTETVPFLYAGLQADLEQAVQKMKSAGASARQSAEMVQMVLSTVRTYPRDAKDDALDRRCISKDVERSRAEVKGVSVPLFLRPPFDKLAQVGFGSSAARSNMQISFASEAREAGWVRARKPPETQKALRPDRVFARPGLFLSKTLARPYCCGLAAGRAGAAGGVAGVAGVAGGFIVRSCAGSCAWSVRSLGEPAKNIRPAAKAIATRMPTTKVTPLPLLSS